MGLQMHPLNKYSLTENAVSCIPLFSIQESPSMHEHFSSRLLYDIRDIISEWSEEISTPVVGESHRVGLNVIANIQQPYSHNCSLVHTSTTAATIKQLFK
uniref:Uncharacterized protein n=1 Tax=Schistocephalus solidus TaxID=70667 RepID=A0A0V0J4W5_SCHSO